MVRPDRVEQAAARRDVTVPFVAVVLVDAVLPAPPLQDRDLLGQHRPARRRIGEFLGEPALLLEAHERGLGVIRVLAARLPFRAAGLDGAVLARVEQVDRRQVAEAQRPVEPHLRPVRPHGGAEGHMLVIGLVGRGPAAQERAGADAAAHVMRIGIVVRHLVVVRYRRPGKGGVRRLQVGVELVEGVTVAVGLQRLHGRGVVPAGLAVVDTALVDVVADMQHEVEVFLGHVAVGGVVAVLVLLAAGDGQLKALQGLRRRGGGACAADRAGVAQRIEAVPVPAAGLEPVHLMAH